MKEKQKWMLEAINNLIQGGLDEVKTATSAVELELKVFCAAAYHGLAYNMEKEKFMERMKDTGRSLPFKKYKEIALEQLEDILRNAVK